MTPTLPYWPCSSLSLALPKCLFLMSEPGQKPLPKGPSSSVTRGKKDHLTYPEHLLCIRLALGYYVHIITFLPHSSSPTIICSFHRGGSRSSAQQCEDSSPGWSNACLCLLPSPHLLSAHALNRCAQLLPHLLMLVAALLVHSPMSTQLHSCSQAHMHQGGCTCVAQTGSPDCYLSAMRT